MPLALFDLDKTLIAGDSDFLWGEFLAEIGAVDAVDYQRKNQYFFEQYNLGKLKMNEYLAFCLKPLSEQTMATLKEWRAQFIAQKIDPIFLPQAKQVVDMHRIKGDTLIVITATNNFISAPIAQKYGIYHLLSTELEVKNYRYTGKIINQPCFQADKITHLKRWLKSCKQDLAGATFYSDSHNDLALLEWVDNPVAVNADPILKGIATEKKWQTLEWKK